jgi:cbb3-type cytochrome oxidase maturation protein
VCAFGGAGVLACLVSGSGHGHEFFGCGAQCLALAQQVFVLRQSIQPLESRLMDILYLLIPLSVALVFAILGALWWAIEGDQFEDIEEEGAKILRDS